MAFDWEWQSAAMNNYGHGWFQIDFEDKSHEFTRFAKEWPETAAFLGIVPPSTSKLFDPGKVFMPRNQPAQIGFQGLLVRHVQGDWGNFGGHSDDVEDSGGAPAVDVGVELANRRALAEQRGVIRALGSRA